MCMQDLGSSCRQKGRASQIAERGRGRVSADLRMTFWVFAVFAIVDCEARSFKKKPLASVPLGVPCRENGYLAGRGR